MLNKNEMKILEKMLDNIKLEFTILGISKALKQKYSQTHKSVKSLIKKELIKVKNKMIKLDFSKYNPDYASAELERLKKKVKNIQQVFNKILKINKQFICILFGSYASGKFKKSSDIDLLFIIPEEYDQTKFERTIKNNLSMYNTDINIATENSLFEMWAAPEKINVGNELLKNHIILLGTEQFINLMGKKDVGREVSKQLPYGKSIVEKLPQDLKLEYSKMKSYSIRSLGNMKKFYETYQKMQTVSAELLFSINWSNNGY